MFTYAWYIFKKNPVIARKGWETRSAWQWGRRLRSIACAGFSGGHVRATWEEHVPRSSKLSIHIYIYIYLVFRFWCVHLLSLESWICCGWLRQNLLKLSPCMFFPHSRAKISTVCAKQRIDTERNASVVLVGADTSLQSCALGSRDFGDCPNSNIFQAKFWSQQVCMMQTCKIPQISLLSPACQFRIQNLWSTQEFWARVCATTGQPCTRRFLLYRPTASQCTDLVRRPAKIKCKEMFSILFRDPYHSFHRALVQAFCMDMCRLVESLCRRPFISPYFSR